LPDSSISCIFLPMEYELPRCSRQCCETERAIAPGEAFYSALISDENDDLVRWDYCAEAWDGPPEETIAWWKSELPEPTETKMQWAPNEVMLRLFDELDSQPERHDMRYVLALLLVRRRVMRSEGEGQDDFGREVMRLYCPRSEAVHEVAVVTPDMERIDEIQGELAELLFSKSL
jgi:hypothetical protein